MVTLDRIYKKWPDKSTTSYDLLHFKQKKPVMDISANSTLNVAKVCLGFAIYDVQYYSCGKLFI